MSVTRKPYGTLPNGEAVEQLTITGKGGLSVSFITYGGTLTNLIFDGKDIALGYTSLEEYLHEVGCIGVTVGRYANRIAGGKFELNGKTYDVGCNENEFCHLHGGAGGWQVKNWEVAAVEDAAITLRQFSPDGEVGYPGNVTADVHISVTPDNTLSFEYTATSDKDTILNMTQHAYFNLNGYDGGNHLDTLLQISANSILPVDDHLIPLGEALPVEGTPFDFREFKPIGRDINDSHEQIKLGNGYDHNFILKGEANAWKHCATAISPKTGIRMDCYTDQPGVQLYTGNMLKVDFGKGGPMSQYQGFCLETQHFPDSPNNPDYPSTVLKAGETYHTVTEYRFSKI